MMELTHETHMKLHGCHPMATKETQSNYRKTMMERHGTINTIEVAKRNGTYVSAWEKDEVKQKIKNTFDKKYGGHPMQNDESFQNNLKSRVKFKDYIMPSGKVIKLQGYEDKGLDILLEKYKEDDILTDVKSINKQIGIIRYTVNKKEHRYYPDFYIISTNTIYEVKSGWTYNANKKKNELKKKRCLELGFNFEFMLF